MICLLLILYILLNNGKDRIEIYLKAVVIWTLILLVFIYLGSVMHSISFLFLLCSYIFLDTVLLIYAYRGGRLSLRSFKALHFRGGLKFSIILEVMVILVLFGIVVYYALKSVPYNWDSMTYHLARIANWEQNKTVFPYATHIERQVASPVLGAYVNLFVYILGGKHDRMLNLLQCASYGTNALLVYGISRKLGIERKIALLAPIFYLCMPIALAEATTTQVDNFATLWLLAFTYLMLEYVNSNKELKWNKDTIYHIVYAVLCAAMGYLAKPSVCFAILMFLLWLLIICIKRKTDVRVIVKYLMLAVLIMAVVLLPSFICNGIAFGSVLHSAVGQRQLIGSWKPRYIFVNFLKNFTFNLASEKLETTRIIIENFLYKIASMLKIDLNDPAISEDGRVFEFPDFPALNCDVALNMFLLVASLCLFVWFLFRYKKQSQMMRGFSIYAFSSFFIFCCFLRWEKFINRYMITYFALLTVFIVIQVHDISRKIRQSIICFGLCMFLILGNIVNYCNGIQYLNSIAPFTKPDGYFTYYGNIEEEYVTIVNEIKASGSGKVGLVIREDSFEYPIWSMLKNQDYEIRHIMVNNSLGKYEVFDFVPDYVIMERGSQETFFYHDEEYYLQRGGSDNIFSLYIKKL